VRALVTGACGFVGRYLTEHLCSKGDEVLGTTFSSTFEEANHNSATLDVSDEEACRSLVSEFAPEAVYHLAGISFVPEAEKNFPQALKVNVAGTHNILKAVAALASEVKVLYVSSAEVYGKIQSSMLPISEKTPLNPANNYSLSKRMAELVCQRFASNSNLNIVVARPFNHIGPGQSAQFVTSSFASQLAKMRNSGAEPVLSVGNLEASRDFSHVKDIVAGYRLALLKTPFVASGRLECFNFSSGKALSIQSILDYLIEISGLKVQVRQDPDRMRPSDVPVLYGSYEKAKIELGWEPEWDIYDTLNEIYQFWLKKK